MLLQLPKDILHYILSIVVFEEFVEKYIFYGAHKIESLTEEYVFHSWYDDGKLSGTFRTLSRIHPQLRQILRSFTIFTEMNGRPRFRLKRQFFNTLAFARGEN